MRRLVPRVGLRNQPPSRPCASTLGPANRGAGRIPVIAAQRSAQACGEEYTLRIVSGYHKIKPNSQPVLHEIGLIEGRPGCLLAITS
jgi:hypothetical protein